MDKATNRQPGAMILALFAVVILVAIVVTALLAGSRTRQYEPGTPQAAAQAYIQAIFDGNEDAAHDLMTTEAQRQCDGANLLPSGSRGAQSARFGEVTVKGSRAEIVVVVDSGFTQETELVLERVNDVWLVDEAAWPFGRCF